LTALKDEKNCCRNFGLKEEAKFLPRQGKKTHDSQTKRQKNGSRKDNPIKSRENKYGE